MILSRFAVHHLSKVSGILGMISCVMMACGIEPRSISKQKVFIEPKVLTGESVSQKLSISSVPHQMIREKIDGGQYLFDQFRYDVVFEPMSLQQFNELKSYFGGWSRESNLTEYQAGRRYGLKDFLPPLMRALLNLRFESETQEVIDLDGQSVEVTTLANCWGTMYEVLREAKEASGRFSVFYAHDDVMKEFLFDQTYSREVKSFSKNPDDFSSSERRNKGLRPGDVIIVGREYVYHVFIYLDQDLYFEKSGSGDKTMFRLSTYETLSKTWFPEVYGWSVRRFDQAKLPEPMTLFGIQKVFSGKTVANKFSSEVAKNISAVERDVNSPSKFLYFLRKFYRFNEAEGLVYQVEN